MPNTTRTFKVAWFTKAAYKAGISDKVLCAALKDIQQGKVDDLGGGVFKKRLNQNRHRSIILAKGKKYWIFQYLFAKKDRDNIDRAELAGFRKIAGEYEQLSSRQIDALLDDGTLTEICHDNKAQA